MTQWRVVVDCVPTNQPTSDAVINTSASHVIH